MTNDAGVGGAVQPGSHGRHDCVPLPPHRVPRRFRHPLARRQKGPLPRRPPLPRGTEQPSKQKGNGLDVSERHLGFDTFDLVEQMLVSHHFTRDGDDDGR